MELRRLRHVLALVESGNFHKAAETLGLTQPALTKSLQQIERDLGVRLFDRHGKSVVPTVFGEVVARAARQVIDTLVNMERTIGQTAHLETGELSVGAGSYVADVWLGPVAGRLLRRYPKLRLALHVEPWQALPDLLRQGRIDLFVANIEHVRGLKEFRVVEFPPQRAIWVCRGGHPLTTGNAPRRAALRGFPMVGPRLPESVLSWLTEDCGPATALARKIDTTSVTMIKAMIRSGDAVSLVHPDMVRAEVAGGEFVTLELDEPPLVFHAGIVWLADRSLAPAALAFARELLVEVGLDPEEPRF